MYAQTGKLSAHPASRQHLTSLLLHAAALVGQMPGCHLYAVGEAVDNDTDVWVMEIWADQAAHDASLQRPDVRALIAQARPHIAGLDGATLRLLGGHGVPQTGEG
jgi:quinol monooxygenase YgiN